MLHDLRPAPGSRFKRKRIARGNSAGGGTTAGRGTKGQHARTGKGKRLGYEGGQVALITRQPKLGGFRSPRKIHFDILNVETLERHLEPGTYDVAALRLHGLVRGKRPVKLLANGSVSKKFDLTVHASSASAKAMIEKAGGSLTLIK